MFALFRILCLSTLIGFAFNAQAAPKLNGAAVHTELAVDQFVAALYCDAPTKDAKSVLVSNESKIMEIRILSDKLYTRQFTRMWIEGIAINADTKELERHAQNLADFSNYFRIKLKPNDAIKIIRLPGTGTRLEVNGAHLGTINDVGFFDLLLRTWIGPVPLSSSFRDSLLAEGNIAPEIKQRFDSAMPSAERIAATGGAIKAEAQRLAKAEALAKQAELAAQNEEKKKEAGAAIPTPGSATAVVPPPPTKTPDAKGLASEKTLFADDDSTNSDEKVAAFTAESLLTTQVYISKLTKWTGGFVRYPRSALMANQEGTVRLSVTINRNGKVLDVQYVEQSKFPALNAAAKKAAQAASPYPAMPDPVIGDTLKFNVPVVFRLQ